MGLRLLSLDGGGTRGLSSIYILRELMSYVVSGEGGHIRPCDYFDLIAGTGLNGLCALLFIRFSYTINEALDFLHDLVKALDEVENLRNKIMDDTGEQNAKTKSWAEYMREFQDPKEQLEALRQKVIQNCWFTAINKNVSDGLERYKYTNGAVFDYMAVDGKTEPGRAKAFVVSSESKGNGTDGGVSDDRQYHAPILHRTYQCRQRDANYTLYAIGLGTVASPSIIKPGVIFPILIATGKHSEHNPTELILEESRRLWPGFRISLLISIGTGTFDTTKYPLTLLVQDTGKACAEIIKKNKEIADKIDEFHVPYDEMLAGGYFRFDNMDINTFFEYSERDHIRETIRAWMEIPEQIIGCDLTHKTLLQNRFLRPLEDMLLLSALGSLLFSLSVAGYSYESLLISDVIATYILYEPDPTVEATYRKFFAASRSEELAESVLSRHETYVGPSELPQGPEPEETLQETMKFLYDELLREDRPPRKLRTIFDVAPSLYPWLILGRENKMSELDEQKFARQFEEFWAHSELPSPSDPSFEERIQGLVQLGATAALCCAATMQLLHCVKSLAYNGDLIRQLRHVLDKIPVSGISAMVIDPIANLISQLLERGHWSFADDDIILCLLDTKIFGGHAWSQVNLALKRGQMNTDQSRDPTCKHTNVISACLKFLSDHEDTWRTHIQDMIVPCVQNGWFALIRKALWAEELTSMDRAERGPNFIQHTVTAMHLVGKAGHPYTLKVIVESLGLDYCEVIVNQPNAQGLTAVHMACKHRAPKEIFRLFEVLKGDVNERCHLGRTPLSYCFPDKSNVPGMYQDVRKLIRDFALPTTVPLKMPQIWRPEGSKTIDPRTHTFRGIINQLITMKVEIAVVDDEGMTPLHHAAKEGWLENLDVFFANRSQDVEDCLILRDHNGYTMLEYARMLGKATESDRGEDSIVAQMEKLELSILTEVGSGQEVLESPESNVVPGGEDQ